MNASIMGKNKSMIVNSVNRSLYVSFLNIQSNKFIGG
jgi:hypothetical protein